MATVTIYLKYENGDLYYSMDNVSFSEMNESTVTGADPGDTVKWVCSDNSIDKINNIKVNKNKSSGGNWKDIWSVKPKAQQGSNGRIFEGVLNDTQEPVSNPAINGYDINYKTQDGTIKDKDPIIQKPRTA